MSEDLTGASPARASIEDPSTGGQSKKRGYVDAGPFVPLVLPLKFACRYLGIPERGLRERFRRMRLPAEALRQDGRALWVDVALVAAHVRSLPIALPRRKKQDGE